MAKRHYTLPHFLRNINVDLLKAYFEKAQIPLPDNLRAENTDKKPDVEAVVDYIKSLDTERQNRINDDFINVNEMSYEGGILSILELAERFDTHLQKEIENLADFNNQALFLFTSYTDLFIEASMLETYMNLKSKSIRYGLLKKDASVITTEEIKTALQNGLTDYFSKNEGRGEICEIDILPHRDRVVFHAHPQDYYKIFDSYDENGKQKRNVIRPRFEVIYFYYPAEGKIELSVNGGDKRKQELFNIFNLHVLGDENPVAETQQTYDFNKILSPDFKMPTKVEDQISWRYLKQLRLSYRYEPGKKIILEIDDKGDKDGPTTMKKMVEELHLNTERLNVTQATFKIKFPGAKNKGSVTARITYPDKCNLTDTQTHQKAKEYLKYWKLELNNEQ